jgi:hypothetical protein
MQKPNFKMPHQNVIPNFNKEVHLRASFLNVNFDFWISIFDFARRGGEANDTMEMLQLWPHVWGRYAA